MMQLTLLLLSCFIWTIVLSLNETSYVTKRAQMDDLGNVINSFGKENRCFVSLQNYDFIDFAEQEIPIQINRTPVMMLKSYNKWLQNRQGNGMRLPKNSTVLGGADRGLSRFWSTLGLQGVHESQFVAINLTEFWGKSRPWNCYIQIQLCALNSIGSETRYFPNILHFPQKTLILRHNIIPSSVPPVQVLIFDKLQLQRHVKTLMENQIQASMHSLTSTISQDLVFLVETFQLDEFLTTRIHVNGISVYQVCNVHFRLSDNLGTLLISHKIPDFTWFLGGRWKKLSMLTCNHAQGKKTLRWIIDLDTDGYKSELGVENFVRDIIVEFRKCKDFSFQEIIRGNAKHYPSTRMARAYVKVWRSIMGNFTYTQLAQPSISCNILGNTKYDSGKYSFAIHLQISSLLNSFAGGSHLYPVVINEQPMQNLKFVSCGIRGFQGLGFDNL